MPEYQHHWKDGTPVHLPLGKIVCIGRNYAEHARELNNPVPDEPLLFIKPSTAAVHITRPIDFPRDRGEAHFEPELAVLIGRPLTNASSREAHSPSLGHALALDLPRRDDQGKLKEKGQPSEQAKAFEGASRPSPSVPVGNLQQAHLAFPIDMDREGRQSVDTGDMGNPI